MRANTPFMAKKTGGWGESIKTVLYAGLIAIGVRTVAFEPFNIPSGSMIPTLLVGDYLFVSKFSYGYSRHSMPFSPNLFSGRIFGRLPERGDVAVFKLPRDNSTDYIKRIVGLPGDRIQVVGCILGHARCGLGGILHFKRPADQIGLLDLVAVDGRRTGA